jgi:hypothetical protein
MNRIKLSCRVNSPLEPTAAAGPRADAPEWPSLNTSQGLTGTPVSLALTISWVS